MRKLLAYKGTYTIVSLFLAVVFAAQMLVLDEAYFGFIKEYRNKKYRSSRYEFVIQLVNEEQVNAALNNFPERISDYKDITLVGYSLISSGTAEIVTFYPEPDSKRYTYIESGASVFDLLPGEIITNDSWNVSGMNTAGEQFMSIRQSAYKVVGFGSAAELYQSSMEMGASTSIMTTYEDFFAIVSRVKDIVIQYDQPLTKAEEKALIDYIEFCFGYEQYKAPESINSDDLHELFMRMLFTITMVVLCLVCNFSIVSYLFFRLKEEYLVRIICGAQRYIVFLSKMCDLFITAVISSLFGTIIYLTVIYSIEADRNVKDSMLFAGCNFLIYLAALFIVFGVGSMLSAVTKRGGVYEHIN